VTAGVIELAELMLTSSERRLEFASRNVANTSTPGYKRQVSFDDVVASARPTTTPSVSAYSDFSQGVLRQTGNALDLAITGAGFFAVRSDDQVFYTRDGQFQRAPDGRLVDAHGYALQSADGGDLVVNDEHPRINADGSVIENNLPVAQIGVFVGEPEHPMKALGGALFSADAQGMSPSSTPSLRQGALETANVDMAAEMLSMMTTLRQAEAGARLVQAYDSLTEESISTFGRSGR